MQRGKEGPKGVQNIGIGTGPQEIIWTFGGKHWRLRKYKQRRGVKYSSAMKGEVAHGQTKPLLAPNFCKIRPIVEKQTFSWFLKAMRST